METIPYYITREFIREHTEWNFVYPTSFWHNQVVGPAIICRNLPNCFGVPVRWRLCKSSGYFKDSQRDEIIKQIDIDINAIPRDKPIICFPKIGNGNSLMYKFAPIAYGYLKKCLAEIETKVVRRY